MAISCAYCGDTHQKPVEIRECWERSGQVEVPFFSEEPPPQRALKSSPDTPPLFAGSARQGGLPSRARRGAERPASPAHRSSSAPVGLTAGVERAVASAAAGPDQLGRWLLVTAGQLIPYPWRSSPTLTLDREQLAAPADLLARLRRAAADAERIVIKVNDTLNVDRPPLLMTDADPYRVGARFLFERDDLHHLLWANTVDARFGDQRWLLLDQAIAAGASPADGDAGDVILPDGTVVWLDGGPVRHISPIDGVPVVHAVAVEHRSFVPPGLNHSEAELAPDQLAAVTHAGGAARIIAPAGSGKTRVLTERARHLLIGWNVPASALTLVAFNKRAQEEMSERTPDLPSLHVRTLNAIGLAIINGSAPFATQQQRWRTINEPDVRRIIGDLVSFPRRRNSDPVAPWIEALSLVRLGLVAPDEVETRIGSDVDGFAEFWPRWCSVLERKGLVDFDDQIYRALRILLSDPVARRQAQQACRILLVDEFQDLTPAHLLLVRLLSAPGGAVFGVGDDDQTIYGYNGADPAWLIDFDELFPMAGAHPLQVNYRCPSAVVVAADRLLRHNRRRVEKVIVARSDRAPDDGGWTIDASVDVVGATVGAIKNALLSGAVASDIAVLSRVNAALAPVQAALIGEGIPISGGVGLEFIERTAVRSVLAWLRLADQHRRFAPDDLREALRRPSRSFHPRITDWIAEQGDVVGLFKLAGRLNNERDADRLMAFAEDVHRLQQECKAGALTSDLTLTLVNEIGLAGAVSTLDVTRRGMNRGAQGDDLSAMTLLAALHDDAATFGAWLSRQLAATRSADGVTLATVHRVKGQEWPHVVVHHADAEQYPHRLAEDVEEERRLFHVALTRASHFVTITPGPTPSPFVENLTTEPSLDQVVSSQPPATERRTISKKSSSPSNDPIADLDESAAVRFERLRTLRGELAAGKPAYVVFDNKTLAMIARLAPRSTRELGKISGVGPAKLDKYGAAVIALLDELR